MGVIKDRFKEKADVLAAEIKDLLKEHGNKIIGKYSCHRFTRECVASPVW